MTKADMNFWTRAGVAMFIAGFVFSYLNYYPHQSIETTSSGAPVTLGEVVEHWQYWLPFFASIAGIVLVFVDTHGQSPWHYFRSSFA